MPRTIALVIDQSLSMGYKSGDDTRLELAKRQAHAVIDDLKPGDAIALIAASDRANPLIAEPTVDHVAARKAIDGIQLLETRTDFSPSLREARKAVTPAGVTEYSRRGRPLRADVPPAGATMATAGGWSAMTPISVLTGEVPRLPEVSVAIADTLI